MTQLADVMEATAIRPLHVDSPEAELTALRRRITPTRFPEKEPVTDHPQGVPLDTVQKLLARLRFLGQADRDCLGPERIARTWNVLMKRLQSNTIVLAGMRRGQQNVLIELVDAEGNVFTARAVAFHSSGKKGRP